MADKALATFAATARDGVDLSRLSGALLEVIKENVHPTHLSLWFANRDREVTR